jgi:hypothetical protein
VIPFSSVSKNGRDAVLARMGEAVRSGQEEPAEERD